MKKVELICALSLFLLMTQSSASIVKTPTTINAVGQQVQTDIDRSERLFLDGRFKEALALMDKVATALSR